jgi:hypothetical protein
MGLITISGQPGCPTFEVARIAAQRLAFELVTESRLTALLPEEFAISGPVPERAWLDVMFALVGPLATEYRLILCFDGAERLAPEFPGSLRARITAPEAVRAGNLMVDRRLERGPARQCLADLDKDHKAISKKRFGRVSPSPDDYDLVINTGVLSSEAAADLIHSAAHSVGLAAGELLSPADASHLEFRVRLRLARHGITPGIGRVGHIDLPPKQFVNSSEEIFANLLDFYRIAWEYEPRSFPIQWDKDGHVSEAFTPDFFLPEFNLFVELTTMKQAHVTKKNRKVRLLREIYPHVNIQVFYQKDFENLMFKYGLVRDTEIETRSK